MLFEEAFDHRVHLLRHFELVEVPCTDCDSYLEIGFQLAQPERVRVFSEFCSDEQDRQLATSERSSAVPLAHTTDYRSGDRLRDAAHVIDDPAR